MTVLNIRLVRELGEITPDGSSPVCFSAPMTTDATEEPTQTTAPSLSRIERDPELTLHSSPTGVPNVPQNGGLSLQEIYEKTIQSVVSISCSGAYHTSTGTGVILTADGYVATNAHVIEGASAVQVILQDKQIFDAVIVGSDEITDLAVLKITAEDLSPATLGDSAALRVGDTVVAIGDPLGLALSGSMTDGIVSAINRDITIDGRTMTLIQTNAALNSGNSGGPLINCYGQVVGINTMKIGDQMSTAGVEGLGFAIPSSTVKDIVTQLIKQGYVSGRPTLGLRGEGLSSFYQVYFHLPSGLYLNEVAANSDAARKGIQPGDIVLAMDGVRITSQEDLDALVFTHQVGDTVELTIYRSGRQATVTLTVQEDVG
jgi:serine protease Do